MQAIETGIDCALLSLLVVLLYGIDVYMSPRSQNIWW